MPNPVAVFLDLETVDQQDLDLGSLHKLPFNWRWFPQTSVNETAERIQGAEVVISNKVRLDAELLRRADALKLICIAATGTNNVDLKRAGELGIRVSNVTGYATAAVVQHVFSLILALSTRLPEYRQAIERGAWQRSNSFCLLDYPIREIAGKRLGIVGYGELGRGVARIGEAFGMEVLIAQRPGTAARKDRVPLQDLLPVVDVLSLHCPLTDKTRNLISQRELAGMRDDALLINTARGGIVDENALASALREGRLGGAGVDVLSEEPPKSGNPLLDSTVPNLILTPHIAWASRESRQRLLEDVAANIAAYLRGEVRNSVTV